MACGYYCMRFDCYSGMEIDAESLLGTSFEKRLYNGVPQDNYVIYDPIRNGITVRTILGGPYPTLMIAEQGCPDLEDSDSASSSFSESEEESDSASESGSGSEPQEPFECEDDPIEDACSYRIVNLNDLEYCCSPTATFADLGPDNNILTKNGQGHWTGSYDTGGGVAYTLDMGRGPGPVVYNDQIYGANGEQVYFLSITCASETIDLIWFGVVEEDPTGEFDQLMGCNDGFGSLILEPVDDSSDSNSSSFSL